MTDPPSPDGVQTPVTESAPEELDKVVDGITGFISAQVAAADRDGVVAEIDGGLNAAVAAILTVRALDADRVLGVLPGATAAAEDGTATLVAEGLGIEHDTLTIPDPDAVLGDVPKRTIDRVGAARARTNALVRLRMVCVYHVADVMNRLVVGTEDRTARLLGTTTKHGPDQGDLLPLGHLYRTEVERLADHIGIPSGVCEPDPVPIDVPGGGPLAPATVDDVLRGLVDEDAGIEQTAADLDVSVSTARAIAARHAETRRTRLPPPTPRTWDDDRYDRFHEIELRFG